MKNRRLPGKGRMTLLLSLAAGLLFLPRLSIPVQAHEFSEPECSLCHSRGGGEGSWDVQAPAEDISPRCVNCHQSCDNWVSHEGRQGRLAAMDRALPLSGESTVVCVTCHDPHGGVEGSAGAGEKEFLRIGNLKRELCLNCHRRGEEPGWALVVSAPPEKAVVYDEHLPLLGKAEGIPGSHLEVRINDAVFPLAVRADSFHTRLRVREGLNVIEISFKGERLWRGEVFRSAEEEETRYDRAFFSHQTGSLDECFGCHREREGLLGADTAEAPALCYGCHDPFDDKRYLHGPLAVGDCMTCHDPHGGSGPSHLKEREVDLCRGCHGDNEVFGHDGGRQAVAEGTCSACHDPHQSDARFLIKSAGL